jgi:Uma2 family endonuclease
MTMSKLDDIKSAIQQLSAYEHSMLQSWLMLGGRVAEPALAYGTPVEQRRLSVEEYLEFEERSEHRHEYIDGAIDAMSGVSENHDLITGNLFAAIHGHLRGGPCRPHTSDFKVRLKIDQRDLFYYPDVMVSCTREGVDTHYLQYPKLVIEVLSPSTESIDRREKFLSYKQVATVEEYVLASQNTAQITIYRRAENWTPQVLSGLDAVAVFQSIDLSLALRLIYERVL